jgi:hypothetical protein
MADVACADHRIDLFRDRKEGRRPLRSFEMQFIRCVGRRAQAGDAD